jgi:hypothetical protein
VLVPERSLSGVSIAPSLPYDQTKEIASAYEFGPKQASLVSGGPFIAPFLGAPLIAEPRRRIAGDRRAMAEPGSIE